VRSRGACRSCILPPSARCLNPVPTRFPELSPAFPSDSRPTGSRRKRLRPPSSRGLSRVHCPRFRCEFLRASQPRYVPPVELPVNGSGLIFRRTRSQFPACPLLFVFVFLARSLSWSLTLLPCSPLMPFFSPLSPTLCPAPLYPSLPLSYSLLVTSAGARPLSTASDLVARFSEEPIASSYRACHRPRYPLSTEARFILSCSAFSSPAFLFDVFQSCSFLRRYALSHPPSLPSASSARSTRFATLAVIAASRTPLDPGPRQYGVCIESPFVLGCRLH